MVPFEVPDNTLLTVGHGTLELHDLVDLLHSASVDSLVDVRRYPASRRHPHLAGPALATALPATGIGYRWEERLGGRRRLLTDERTRDPWWTVEAFRAYATHTRTPEFQTALFELLRSSSATARLAIMCSESVWWRCHRRLISDVALAAHHLPVWHLMRHSRAVPHRLAAGARVRADGLVVWDRTTGGCLARIGPRCLVQSPDHLAGVGSVPVGERDPGRPHRGLPRVGGRSPDQRR